jgi:hypothetical protein
MAVPSRAATNPPSLSGCSSLPTSVTRSTGGPGLAGESGAIAAISYRILLIDAGAHGGIARSGALKSGHGRPEEHRNQEQDGLLAVI